MGLFSGDFYSECLQMTTHLNVIFPEQSNDVTPVINGDPAVLYLLHGLAANCGEWTRFSKIEYYAKKYNLIVIMPEVQRSFYCTSYSGPDYFRFVADELPEICATWFQIPRNREKTWIAGESMGGYGAVKIGLSCPDRFGAIASLSGVLDYRAIVSRIIDRTWPEMSVEEIKALHGPEADPGEENDVISLVKKTAMNPNRPRLIQICGTEDFLYEDNLRFRDAASEAGYNHTYLEGPGDHEWPFWDKAIQRAIQFFYGLNLTTTPLY